MKEGLLYEALNVAGRPNRRNAPSCAIRIALLLLTGLPLLADTSRDAAPPILLLLHYTKDGSPTRTRVVRVDSRRIAWSVETRDVFEVKPVLLRGRLYLPRSRDGCIETYDASTGSLLWRAQSGKFRAMLPLGHDEFVLSTYEQDLVRVRRNGERFEEVWKSRLESEGRTLATDLKRVYVTTYTHVVCFDLGNGSEVWRSTGDGKCLYGRLCAAGFVAWDWWKGEVHCLDLNTGQSKWHETHNQPWITSVVADRLLMLLGNKFVVVDAATGHDTWSCAGDPLWRNLKSDDEISYVPLVSIPEIHGSVYLASNQAVLQVRDLRTGTERSDIPLSEVPMGLAADSSRLIVAYRDRLAWISARGDSLGEIPLDVDIEYMRRIEGR